MDRITLKDPLGDSVYFNRSSLGIAMISSEISYLVSNRIKRTIQSPTMIFRVSETERIYCIGVISLGQMTLCISKAVLQESEWYIESHYEERDKIIMSGLVHQHKTIYTAE